LKWSGTSRCQAERDLLVTIAHYGAARRGWRARALAENEPTREVWGDGTGDLYLSERILLGHVPSAVWGFELGGYPVIKKWLGYREARRRDGAPLTLAEKDHLRSMVQRIAALLALRVELDALYERASAEAFTVEELGLGAPN
jgi:hypothetical protein